MNVKRKNLKISLTDFLKYRGKKMSGMERNAFEKELQKDPFSTEAAEGFKLIEEETIARDIKLLNKQLKSRTERNKRMSYYRIAASIAVLMVISSVYIVLDRTEPSKLSENVPVADTFEIKEQEALKQNIPEKPASAKPSQAVKKAERRAETEIPEVADKPISDEMVADIEDEEIRKDKIAAEAKKDESSIASGQVTLSAPSEKNDSFLASTSEKKAFVRSASIDNASLGTYQSAQPITGKDSFDIYIQKNIRIPEEQPSVQTFIVRLNLRIGKDGTIENIKVLESPGKEYSNEAIRLIKEGPAWIPAVKEGKPVGENRKLDIIFR